MRSLILLLIILFKVYTPGLLLAQTWSSLGIGLDNRCRALAVDANGKVYVGGEFEKALTNFGDVKVVNNIAFWNGSEWLPLGKGVDGPVYALAMDKNKRYLYVGGSFSNAFNSNGIFISTANIARWDKLTGSWSAVGSGLDDVCLELFIDDNNVLYAGGKFSKAGGIPAKSIAKWESGVWSSLGSGLTGICRAIVKDSKGMLYAGGDIAGAGGIPAVALARWDGNVWSNFAPGITGATQTVNALSLDAQDRLYAGGWFHGTSGIASNNILMWDGSQWQGVGGGLQNGQVTALAFDSLDHLFVGGSFEESSGGLLSLPNIAFWNGNWNALDGGLDDICYDIAIGPDGTVYAAGDFEIAGNVEARCIARWTPAWVGTRVPLSSEKEIRLYPQPAGDFLRIDLQEAFRPSDMLTLTIMATDGRILGTRQLSGSTAYQLFTADLPGGFYLLQLQSAQKQITRVFIRQ